jgi:hypothetical protein
MHKSQPLQASASAAHCAQAGDHDPFEIPDHNLFHLARSMEEQSNLAIQLKRELTQGSGHLRGYDLFPRNPLAGQPLQGRELMLLQTADISTESGDGVALHNP